MTELGGVITQISCSYERKVSDGDYGSVGGFFSVTMDLHVGVDPDNAFDALYEWVKQAATRNLKPSFDAIVEKKEDSTKTQPATVAHEPFGPPAPEIEDAKAEEPMAVVKFTLARRTDDNFQLELYKMYGKNVGKYSDIKYVAGRQEMWDMMEPVLTDEDVSKLPIEYECSWWADWKYGREKPKGEGRYMDLVKLRPR
jgi:hypothetical protein